MKKALLSAVAVAFSLCVGCKSSPDAGSTADAIYYGGPIVTVNDAQPNAEAVAVKDGKILMVGTRSDLERFHKGTTTQMIDLGGMTLMPGFLDAHSHFMFSLDMPTQANVSAPPVGPVKSIPDIVAALKETQQRLNIRKGEWIVGWGYDGNELAEKREATRDDLDPAFPDNPVMVIHVFSQMPKPSEAELLSRLNGAQQIYASNGYTTIQEGATHAHDVKFLKKAASQKLLYLDVVSLPLFIDLPAVLAAYPAGTWGQYDNRLKLGGVKTVWDGSPQGKTAFFTKPYLTGGPAGQKNWHGESGFSEEVFIKYMKPVYDNNLRTFDHCNGDAAVDMFLDVHEKLGGKAELRPVVIHSQFVRADQLDRYAKLGVVPSMFPLHTYFFGDVHVKNLGMERASFMSPTNSGIKKGLHITLHSDFNVLPLDPMFIIWTAMNRTTRTGVLLGGDERLTAMQAVKAITIETAYEYMEEKTKGSIEPGKLADLVILSGNPITSSGDAIRDIKVVETIKEGKSVYKRTAP
jgi:predicted amidohydrolase YtcJ